MGTVTADFRIETEHDGYACALEAVVEARLAGIEPSRPRPPVS